MPGKLVITRGLPGSGKTTWAMAQVASSPIGDVIRANRDDLRAAMFGPAYSTPVYACEEQVTVVQRAIVERGLRDGRIVIVDDMNLRSRYVNEWLRLATKLGAEFAVEDFTGVDLDTCINRDSWRAMHGGRHVGDELIRDLHQRFVAGGRPVELRQAPAPVTGKPYTGTPGKRKAVIIDIDGTVALHGDRNPYDTSRYHEDGPNEPVIEQVRLAADAGYALLFTSGRDREFEQVTAEWICNHVLIDPELDWEWELIMRPQGDTRNDAVVKIELFDEHIRDNYDVRWVLDDRDRVVKAWRSIGLAVMQVAPGDF